MDFTDARHIARMSRTEVMEYLQISKSTLYRYEKTGKAPKAIIECLLMVGGRLPTFKHNLRGGTFSGWSFSNGYIYSDNGYKFTSGDVMAIRTDKALIEELSKQNRLMKKQLINNSRPSNVIPFPTFIRETSQKA